MSARNLFPLAVLFALLCSCTNNGGETAVVLPGQGAPYQIDGFYIFPLEEILVGDGAAEVRAAFGEPTEILTRDFREPMRVPLPTLPEFDEQWEFGRMLESDWIFFRDGRVVAAFKEASDW